VIVSRLVGCAQLDTMKYSKRFKKLMAKSLLPRSRDGLSGTAKIFAVKFYNGQPYYGRLYLKSDYQPDEPNEFCTPDR
jgi:hypothetical protein